ncbi:MAG TPA: class I SAM-dependent methyltransferase [Longimicrobium sp.]|nr:class I SAM-dependent methyltransferase [Longimicrobium sp.]
MERVVSEVVLDSCRSAEQAGRLAEFYTNLRIAADELYNLGARENVDYGLERIGEAYALWYHMRRVASVYQALETLREDLKRALWDDREWRVLDVGSGTCAAAMAIMRWLADNEEGADLVSTCSVLAIEPSHSMRRIGDGIVARFGTAIGREFDRYDVLPHTLQEAPIDGERKFDLIIFSTTFDFLTGRAREEMMKSVVRLVEQHLAVWGTVLFIVPVGGPDENSKWDFVQELGDRVRTVPQVSWCTVGDLVELPAEGVQQALENVRGAFNRGAAALGQPPVFPTGAGVPGDERKPRYLADVRPRALRRKPPR